MIGNRQKKWPKSPNLVENITLTLEYIEIEMCLFRCFLTKSAHSIFGNQKQNGYFSKGSNTQFFDYRK